MPTYTTQAACLAYIPGLVITDPAGFDKTIEEAERAVDVLLRARGQRNLLTGLMVTPSLLEPWRVAALSRATAAQVQFMLSPEFKSVDAGVKAATGPDFSVTYADRAGGDDARIGPKVKRELRSGGLLSAWARVA